MRDALVTPLLDAALRGAVVLLAALVLTTLLHRRSAALRHAIWAGAIAAQLVLLGLALWGPRWRVAAPEVVSALVPVSAVESEAAPPSESRPAPVTSVPGPGGTRYVVTRTDSLAAPRAADAASSTPAAETRNAGAPPVLAHDDPLRALGARRGGGDAPARRRDRHRGAARAPGAPRRRRRLALARAAPREHAAHRSPAHADARRPARRAGDLGDRVPHRAPSRGRRRMARGAAPLRARARDGAREAARRAHPARRPGRARPVLVQSVRCGSPSAACSSSASTRATTTCCSTAPSPRATPPICSRWCSRSARRRIARRSPRSPRSPWRAAASSRGACSPSSIPCSTVIPSTEDARS